MADAPVMNERAQLLLKTLIEHYIAEGQPVGSRALSKFSGLDLSPADVARLHEDVTNVVRKQANDMADLAQQVRRAVRGYRQGKDA